MRIKSGTRHLGKLGQFVDPTNGYIAENRSKKVTQNPALPRNRVEVKALRTAHGEDFLEIFVYSTHGSGMLAAKATIRPSQFTSSHSLLDAIEVAGGAGAEHLATAYGDVLDPGQCAKYAKELGIEALQKIHESYNVERVEVYRSDRRDSHRGYSST